MPIQYKSDINGNYIQFGNKGKKYYYKTEHGKKIALAKAKQQMKAIEWRKYKQ